MRIALQPRAVLFAAIALGVYLTAVVLGGRLGSLPNGGDIAVALTIDLTLLVPAACYLLVIRPRRWSIASVAPVVIVGLSIAGFVIPAVYQAPVRVVEALLIPVEFALLSWVVWRAAHGFRAAGHMDAVDPLGRLQASAEAVVPRRVASVVAAELAVMYYALAAWRARPHVPPGTVAYSTHRQSGQGGIVFALVLITAVEGFVVHLLLSGWSEVAAWIATGLSVYGALWLVADYRASVLSPVTFDGTVLWLRCGLRWRGSVERQQLVRVARTPLAGEARTQALTLLAEPNVWLECARPVALNGLLGIRREVTRIGLCVDEPDQLVAQLALPRAAGMP